MKQIYLDLMEKTLSAYSDAHIVEYFEGVKTNGLKDQGFARLTSNIGTLVANGRRRDLLPLFQDMMEFCCKTIPKVKAANDFSVREIICALTAVEKSNVICAEVIARWKAYLASIEPTSCYSVYAVTPTDNVRNWALFTGVSEYFRQSVGLCESTEFIDMQIASQLQWLDENGMYMDNSDSDVHQPIVYDLVPRALFALLLHRGYRGKYYEQVDSCLKKAGLVTLGMQSSNGEIAYGGRSNQFLHNEGWLSIILEYEANRYAKEGNTMLAGVFKAAVSRALGSIASWLDKKPIRHIKNCFPTETKYGCEDYAYFDKYMITTASCLYGAFLICDDSISMGTARDYSPTVMQTSQHFHKLFMRCGGYALEYDWNGDIKYDASGLGRIHYVNAPASICLSSPCPNPPRQCYKVDIADQTALSMCPGIYYDEKWHYATDPSVVHTVQNVYKGESFAEAEVICIFEAGQKVIAKYTVNAAGVQINVEGDGQIAFLLPAFSFDGSVSPEIVQERNCLSVTHEGWTCRYTTDGAICDLHKLTANRNGHYRIFSVTAQNKICIQIEIAQKGF